MAVPVNGMNVGVDYTITYYESVSGGLINLGDVQDVKITALKHDIKSAPYNQLSRYGFMDDGFKIDFTIIRNSSTLEDLAVLNSANIQAGNVQGAGYLNQTTINADGSVSRWQYTNFVVFLTDHGDISREKAVTIKLEGMASAKVKIA
jgi:hypothetical protein